MWDGEEGMDGMDGMDGMGWMGWIGWVGRMDGMGERDGWMGWVGRMIWTDGRPGLLAGVSPDCMSTKCKDIARRMRNRCPWHALKTRRAYLRANLAHQFTAG